MAFTLPPLNRQSAIIGTAGRASDAFAQYWQRVLNAIGGAITDIRSTNERQDAQLAQLLAVQAAVNSQAAGLPSGTSGPTRFGVSSGTRIIAGSVNLTGVVAGTLRFDTTRLNADSLTTVTAGPLAGTYWITEEPTSGGTKTDILTGSWTATLPGPGEPVEIVFPDATVDAARPATTNTGAVTYRLELARASGSAVLTNAIATFRAGQAS